MPRTLKCFSGLSVFFLLGTFLSNAQVSNPYFLNGSATQDNCNCYTLTRESLDQSGSVWNIYKIDLNETFDFKFSVFLGSLDATGADGIAFVLQPISTNIGTTGEGLGFGGVIPSIGVTIDTWQNTNHNDPVFDHISIQRDGNLDHNTSNNLAGPFTALDNNLNIEDGQWHMLRIVWDPAAKTLKAYMDDVERVSTNIDLINEVFKGDPMVFWGFSASTGGSTNLQRFCTALNPGINSLNNVKTCFGTPIQFTDNSTSFGKIVKWFWDLGDGTKDTLQQIPPHTYTSPGIYDVKLNILGNNGCLSDTFKMKVTVGTDPVANIGYQPAYLCEGRPIQLLDSSRVQFGTINRWNWVADNTGFTFPDPTLQQGLSSGIHTATLQVRTVEGCVSEITSRNLSVTPVPVIDFVAPQICAGETINLVATNTTPAIPVTKWIWQIDSDTYDSTGGSIRTSYQTAGLFPVRLEAISSNGCASEIIEKQVSVFSTDAFAGNDTIVAIDQPFQLQGSGGVIYNWSPPFGLSDPNIANPVGVFKDDAELILHASSPAGCPSSDTVKIKVFKGPEIYVPTAFTPNGDNLNDLLKAFPVGLKFEYFKIYDRWGKLIFSTKDFRMGWDGKINGKQPATGSYIWVTQGVENSGRIYSKKGSVVLIR